MNSWHVLNYTVNNQYNILFITRYYFTISQHVIVDQLYLKINVQLPINQTRRTWICSKENTIHEYEVCLQWRMKLVLVPMEKEKL